MTKFFRFSVPCFAVVLASALVQAQVRYIEKGQPPVVIHQTVEGSRAARTSGSPNMYYHGGTSDGSAGSIGVETAPKVYVVFWGSQWNNNDPSGEAGILIGTGRSTGTGGFLGGVGGSGWLNTVTQYCQGVASGTFFCNGAGTAAGNPNGILAGYWYDNGSAAPSHPTQSQLAGEAVNAAAHFGNTSVVANTNAQYVIATATKNSSGGFGAQYCAYHSSTTSSYGDVAYTNLPYITDAGASCGANFNGLGANAGITIVEGHELAETVTDQFPSGGWLDSGGAEIGDKCAWITTGNQGAAADVTLSTGTYAVQSLWSNAFDSDAGGCVLSY
jgi:serine protease